MDATILLAALAPTRAKLARLNRRGARFGWAPIALETRAAPRKIGDEVVVDVTLTGVALAFSGWSLLARVDLIAGERIVARTPAGQGATLPEISDRCDHCRTRRNRTRVYVVRHDDGRELVVGSSCLPDFTGAGRQVEAMIAHVIEAMGALDDGGFGGANYLDVVDVCAWAAMVVRDLGWRPASKEDLPARPSTARVVRILAGDKDRRVAPTRSDRALALRAVHWAAEHGDDAPDYLATIGALARARFGLPRHHALACSIVAAYQRHRGTLRDAGPRVDPIAQIDGPKATFAGEVVERREIAGDYGATTKVTIIAENGATVIWWASGDSEDFALGAVLDIACTVKKHDNYRGVRQTTITRATAVRAWVPERKLTKRERAALSG